MHVRPFHRAVATLLALALVIVLAPSSGALVDDVSESGHGVFSDATRSRSGPMLCLQYGTGDPATFSAVGAVQPGDGIAVTSPHQTSAPGVLNQVRFGQVPSTNGLCSGSPGSSTGLGSSGFGFQGAMSRTAVGEFFELGRFFHYNRTIERGADSVALSADFELRHEPTDSTTPFSTIFDIELVETPDFVRQSNLALCTDFPDNPKNRTDTVLGFVPVTYCADQVTIDQRFPLPRAEIGETSLTIEVGGFTTVDGDDNCDADDVVTGNVVYTSEQNANPFCLLGRVSPGTLVLEKTLEGVADGRFDFAAVEYAQGTDPLEPLAGTDRTLSIDTTDGAGTTGPLEFDPGIYRVTELVDPDGTTITGELACTTDWEDATVTIDGETYLDIDSGETATCSVVNSAPAELSLSKSASSDSIAPGESFVWTIEATNTGPVDAVATIITDEIPAELAIESATASSGSCRIDGQSISCDMGTLEPDASVSVEVTVRVRAETGAGPLINQAQVDAGNADPDQATTAATARVEVVLPPSPTVPDSTPTSADESITTMGTTPTTGDRPTGTLPVTGAETGRLTMLGALLLAAGSLALGWRRVGARS